MKLKTRNYVILALLILGGILYAVVHSIQIPTEQIKGEKYVTDQKNPATHDLSTVLYYQNETMANTGNLTNLFCALPLCDTGLTVRADPEKKEATVQYHAVAGYSAQEQRRAITYNAAAAFALIDDLQAVTFLLPDGSYTATRARAAARYGENLPLLLIRETWREKVQQPLADEASAQQAFEALFTGSSES